MSITRPCPENLTCAEGDFPVINYSAEAPDPFNFLGFTFGKAHCAGIGDRITFMWGSTLHYCFSTVSGEDAILCAKLAAQNDCTGTFGQSSGGNPVTPIRPVGEPPPGGFKGIKQDSPTPNPDSPIGPSNPPEPDDPDDPALPPHHNDQLFFNTQQSCTVCCAGGPCASYTTRVGIFPGSTLAEANLWAAVYACREAILQLPGACRPPLPIYPAFPHFPGSKVTFERFWNDPQTATSACPDGTISSFTAPAAMFPAKTQAIANTLALNYALAQARARRICLSDISGTICVGQPASQTITVTSAKPVAFALIGNLPPGMVLNVDDHSATVAGTPTTPGNYTFSLDATDGVTTVNKSFTIAVLGITNSPPGGSVGAGYNFQFTASGGTPPYTFAVTNGSLPLGLSMSASGVINGTPSAAQTKSFQVTVTDSGP